MILCRNKDTKCEARTHVDDQMYDVGGSIGDSIVDVQHTKCMVSINCRAQQSTTHLIESTHCCFI